MTIICIKIQLGEIVLAKSLPEFKSSNVQSSKTLM